MSDIEPVTPDPTSEEASDRETAPETVADTMPSSTQAAAMLIAANLAMKAGTQILRGAIERGVLRGRFGDNAAEKVLANKNIKGSRIASTAARVATRSKPGALVVGTGLAAKLLFDLSETRRKRLRGQSVDNRAPGDE